MQTIRMRFTRTELAGAIGDLGTLLPLSVGMIAVNGLDAMGLFVGVGLFYLIAGHYYGTPIAVQPMKTIGAYAVATGATATVVHAAGIWMAVLLLLIAWFDGAKRLQRIVPKEVIRGVQVSTGLLLALQGVRFIAGISPLQAKLSEPWLGIGSLAGIPWSLVLGVISLFLLLGLIDSKRFPGALVTIVCGIIFGLIFGEHSITFSPSLPTLLPHGLPGLSDFIIALPAMVLPQLPMTIGNAVFANADLANKYYPEGAARNTPRALCTSMGLACLGGALLGGMPMCHGAGGLAAHYRFGARTGASNLMIGGIFLMLPLLAGQGMFDVVRIIPVAVLGTMLLFAGIELCLAMRDMETRGHLFTIFLMVACTLTFNLTVAFLCGILVAWLMERGVISV